MKKKRTHTPPHSREAEEAVLGGILIDNRALDYVTSVISGADDFYVPAHQDIYTAMLDLYRSGQPIDIITLCAAIKGSGSLESVGGVEYISSLIDATSSTRHVISYAKIVNEKSVIRRTILACREIIDRGMESYGELDEYLDSAERALFASTQRRTASPYTHVAPVVTDVFRAIETASSRSDQVSGLPSGYAALDHYTSGFHPGDLIVIAGRPSMGKTALALNIACQAKDLRILVLSLEMSKEQLVRRMLCSSGPVSSSRVRTGSVGPKDWPRLMEAASTLSKQGIYIDDTPSLSIHDARSKARRLHTEHGLDLVIVDYLQLMRSGDARRESREREISEISRGLKALAKELNVPVIALSQLNRSLESRQDKRPMLSDLRESGAIEQDSDLILFIYRDEVYNKNTPDIGIAELIIGKQRNGPVGTAKVRWSGEYTRFSSLSY